MNTFNHVILGPGRFVGETWGDTDSVSSDSSDSMLDDSLNTSDSDSENEDLQGKKSEILSKNNFKINPDGCR